MKRALRAANLSGFEKHSLLASVLLIVAAVVAMFAESGPGGLARTIALVGLGSVGLCAASRGFRGYRAGIRASLPASVGKVHVRARPARGFNVSTVGLALLMPLAAVVAVLAMFDWTWLLVAGVLIYGCVGMLVTWFREAEGDRSYSMSSASASGLLERLCMQAGMPVPELVVEHGPVANAWTAGGRIHVTSSLLRLLDDGELEAVLAHEVAHLARRDAAVMEICSAPSRVLLTFATFLTPRLPRWTRALWGVPGAGWFLGPTWMLAVFSIPPALVIGWISRLSLLGMSRAREFSADAAAAMLTGRPSALASALMKLDREREWVPRSDLRQADAYAVLCIVGATRSRLGRLLSTHPSTAARVSRLNRFESRIQA